MKVGENVEPFDLVDHDGSPFAHESLTGWYLLYWYPKADTPGCTAQAEGLRDQLEAFDDLGCTVLGASFDPPEVNAAFRSKYSLRFTLLTDRSRQVARTFGAVLDTDQSHPSRIATLVDPSSTAAMIYQVTDPEFFAESVLDDLERLTADYPSQP
jgi:peroxiredoxin Q/BCP